MKPAARKNDTTVHGGWITTGSKNVEIGNMPAAREDDEHYCPVHGFGAIGKLQRHVQINGRAAARRLDPCPCAIATGPYANWYVIDADGDGTPDTAGAQAGLGRLRLEGYDDFGPVELGGRADADVMHVAGEIRKSLDEGGPGSAVQGTNSSGQGEGGVVKMGFGGSIGPKSDKGRNPYFSWYGGLDLIHAGGDFEATSGIHGDKSGGVLQGQGSADAISAHVTERACIPIPGGQTLEIETTISGGSGWGGGGGLWNYADKQDGRHHSGLLFEIGDILKVGLRIHVSIGKRYGGQENVGPNYISGGLDTVLIGD